MRMSVTSFTRRSFRLTYDTCPDECLGTRLRHSRSYITHMGENTTEYQCPKPSCQSQLGIHQYILMLLLNTCTCFVVNEDRILDIRGISSLYHA